jgi:hypothetical protein
LEAPKILKNFQNFPRISIFLEGFVIDLKGFGLVFGRASFYLRAFAQSNFAKATAAGKGAGAAFSFVNLFEEIICGL